MVGGISPRARKYLQDRAEQAMHYTCRIERLGQASFDESTSTYVSGDPEVLYAGKCRIFEVAGGGVQQINDEQIVLQSTQLVIPFDAPLPTFPERNDEVVITAATYDGALVGKRFRILDVAKGGDLRPSRRFTLQGIQDVA